MINESCQTFYIFLIQMNFQRIFITCIVFTQIYLLTVVQALELMAQQIKGVSLKTLHQVELNIQRLLLGKLSEIYHTAWCQQGFSIVFASIAAPQKRIPFVFCCLLPGNNQEVIAELQPDFRLFCTNYKLSNQSPLSKSRRRAMTARPPLFGTSLPL